MNVKNYFKHIFSLNALVNMVIGLIFIFLYEKTEIFLFGTSVFPRYVWIVIGAGFLYFAYWQIRSMAKGKVGKKALAFSLTMALIPALALTVVLLIPVLPFVSGRKLIFLITDIYMIFLGAFYLWLLRDIPDGGKTKSGDTGEN